MYIEWVQLEGYRNFKEAHINLRENSLILGANDVGKTNLLFALRLVLDRSLSETALDPVESDFHVSIDDGKPSESCEIRIKFTKVNKDPIKATLKGAVSDSGETFLVYRADRATLRRTLLIGASLDLLEEIPSRHYLRFVNLRYVQSQRD